MSSRHIPVGEIRGILRVVEHIEGGIYLCKCVKCGNIIKVNSRLLSLTEINRHCIQCKNCYIGKEFHGMKGTRIYRLWGQIKSRANNHDGTHPTYKGVIMCDDWAHSFTKFYKWAISNGYDDNLTIDRIDNNKGYSPDNCRWATKTQQVRNRTNTKYVTYKGEVKPLAEWCDILNLNYNTTWTRLHKYRWSVEKAFTKGVML